MKYIRLRYVVAMLFAVIVTIGVMPSTLVAASPQSVVCTSLGSDAACDATPGNGVGINGVIRAIVDILSVIVGITAVIMIIVAGMKFITASGDSNSISGARQTITYAIVGLVIVAAAQFIVQFVLRRITK